MMNIYDFYESLGYLSNPIRQTKLDAELPIKEQTKFESKYHRLTGIIPKPDNKNYYILHNKVDKWGIELRINFISPGIIPQSLKKMAVQPRPSTKYTHRVNNNEFIWELIQAGFLLGDTQDDNRIRNLVPNKYLNSYNKGLKIC